MSPPLPRQGRKLREGGASTRARAGCAATWLRLACRCWRVPCGRGQLGRGRQSGREQGGICQHRSAPSASVPAQGWGRVCQPLLLWIPVCQGVLGAPPHCRPSCPWIPGPVASRMWPSPSLRASCSRAQLTAPCTEPPPPHQPPSRCLQRGAVPGPSADPGSLRGPLADAMPERLVPRCPVHAGGTGCTVPMSSLEPGPGWGVGTNTPGRLVRTLGPWTQSTAPPA